MSTNVACLLPKISLPANPHHARRYARQSACRAFERCRATAATIKLSRRDGSRQSLLDDRGSILLAKTCQSESVDCQQRMIAEQLFYNQLAIIAVSHWHQHNNCRLVVATAAD